MSERSNGSVPGSASQKAQPWNAFRGPTPKNVFAKASRQSNRPLNHHPHNRSSSRG
jgi:hypothetical protein